VVIDDASRPGGEVEWGQIYDSPTSMPIFQPRCSDQKWVVSCEA